MGDLLRIVLGRPRDLLPFDEVREKLHLRRFVERDVREVPLDRVVGTVGREGDFNRAFLPRKESLRDRGPGGVSACRAVPGRGFLLRGGRASQGIRRAIDEALND